jgi:hypothetical protein
MGCCLTCFGGSGLGTAGEPTYSGAFFFPGPSGIFPPQDEQRRNKKIKKQFRHNLDIKIYSFFRFIIHSLGTIIQVKIYPSFQIDSIFTNLYNKSSAMSL